jgi:hypothetical protein
MTTVKTLVLKDRMSGHRVWLTLKKGIVVGAMGCEPRRYMGLTEKEAFHKATRRTDLSRSKGAG